MAPRSTPGALHGDEADLATRTGMALASKAAEGGFESLVLIHAMNELRASYAGALESRRDNSLSYDVSDSSSKSDELVYTCAPLPRFFASQEHATHPVVGVDPDDGSTQGTAGDHGSWAGEFFSNSSAST